MSNYMQVKEHKFFQLHICANNDSTVSCLLLVEIVGNIPIASFIVKLPESYKFCFETFPYYPEILN